MAKRRVQRDSTLIANEVVDPLSMLDPGPVRFLSPVIDQPTRDELIEVEDRRRFDPEGVFATPSFFSSPAPMLKAVGRGQPPVGIGWSAPDRVAVCVRRKERREVLFAKNRTNGRGSKRRNYWSKVKC